ncbi:YecA family protein [Metabacillus malikii]|nr:SEC-C domain-containing protein [Metabacillus malikii]
MRIGRNDECPCGSGKKYKTCCMKSSVVSLEDIRDRELNSLQEELIVYATTHYDEVLTDVMDEFLREESFTDIAEEIILFYMTVWIIFSVEYVDDRTIIKDFIGQKEKENKLRPSTIAQLENWQGATASFSVVRKVIDAQHIEIEEILSEETRVVKVDEDQLGIEEGQVLMGFLLPYGSYDVYYSTYLDFELMEGQDLAERIKADFDEAETEDEKVFMRMFFPHIFLGMFASSESELVNIDELQWDQSTYLMVALKYKEFIDDEEVPEPFFQIGIMLWNIYCLKEQPLIKKIDNYAAALVYLIDKNVPFFVDYTKNELAQLFNISKGSLESAYRKLEKGIGSDIERMLEMMANDSLFDDEHDDFGFDFDDLFLEGEKFKK